MKRTFVIRLEKQPMTGLVKARCEQEMQNFVVAAATLRRLDPSDIVREAIRNYAVSESVRQPRLKKFAKAITTNGL